MAGVKGRSGGPRLGCGGARLGAGRPKSEKTLFLESFVGPLPLPTRIRYSNEEERQAAKEKKRLAAIEKRRQKKEQEALLNGNQYVRHKRTTKYQCQCQQCGSFFTAILKNTKFCNKQCRENHWNDRQSKRLKAATLEKRSKTLQCMCCGVQFCSLLATSKKYCGNQCKEQARYKTHKEAQSLNWFKNKMRVLVCNALRRNGYKKQSTTEDVLGCTFTEFRRHLEKQFLKGMTWENRHLWHIDHIQPMALAQTQEEAVRLNHHTNLRPMWAKDNIAKRDKVVTLL